MLAGAAGCLTTTAADGALKCAPEGTPCPSGFHCASDRACWRDGHEPQPPMSDPCRDGSRNGAETDTDCGGGSCDACVVGKECLAASDCASSNCDSATHRCVSPQCVDGSTDGAETDVDCGGGVCALCAIGRGCSGNGDCLSSLCSTATHRCVDQCHDGVRDGAESDVDCGGPECGKCAVNLACKGTGDCLTGSCTGDVCQLVSGPPFWVTAPSLSAVRSEHGAAVDQSGNIYAFGGVKNTSGNSQSVTEMLAPGATSWKPLASLVQPCAYPAGGLGTDGRIYVVGGQNGAEIGTLQAYDPVGDSWTTTNLPSLSPVRSGHAVVAAGGTLYSFGGLTTSQVHLNNVDSFTPGATSWISIPSGLTIPITSAGAALGPDGVVYIMGGSNAGTLKDTVQSFNPTTKAFGMVASLSKPRAYMSAATGADLRVYSIGGLDGSPTRTVEAYTASTNGWTAVAPLPAARSFGAAAVGGDNRIYYIAGNSGGLNTPVQDVYAYGPSIALSAVAGSVSSMQTISGSNFAANAAVSLYFGSLPTPIATGTTDANGKLAPALKFNVPPVATSTTPYTIRVVDDKAQYPAVAKFTVQ